MRIGSDDRYVDVLSRPVPLRRGNWTFITQSHVDGLTSTEAHRLETPPDHLVIVGGEYIAAELGHFFGTFGSDVTIIGRRSHLLPEADEEVAAAFTERARAIHRPHRSRRHVGLGTRGDDHRETQPYEDGVNPGIVEGEEGVTVTADELLVAAGRVPNSDTLNVDAAGVETDDCGFVETDEYLRTTADDAWALGDIVGPDASTLIQEVVVAMKSGTGTVHDLRNAVHIHPALSEVVQRAFSGQLSRGDAGHHHQH